MTEEAIKQFQQVLSATTGYYFPMNRARYLLMRVTNEAKDLVGFLDSLDTGAMRRVDEIQQGIEEHRDPHRC